MDDGSRWRIFPGDLDVTLGWEPGSDLKLETVPDNVSSQALVNPADNSRVRVIAAAEHWPVQHVEGVLRNG